MTNLTEESLSVFWLFEDGHEEVPGILAYGYFNNGKYKKLSFPYSLWPDGVKMKTHAYANEFWNIIEWTIQFNQWPKASEWLQIIEGTLLSFTGQGAKIAWCGLEGFFATPPSLFSPLEMSGGVYAILIPDDEFICTALLTKPFQTVSDEELVKAEMIVKG